MTGGKVPQNQDIVKGSPQSSQFGWLKQIHRICCFKIRGGICFSFQSQHVPISLRGMVHILAKNVPNEDFHKKNVNKEMSSLPFQTFWGHR